MSKVLTYLGKTNVVTGLGFGTANNYKLMLSAADGLHPISIAPHPWLTRLEAMMVSVIADVAECVDLSSERTAFIFSTTKGNIANLSTDIPEPQSNIFLHNMAMRVCRAVGYKGNPIVVSNACISGVLAVIIAHRLLQANLYDDIVVVGGDEMTEFTTSGFMAFKSVSSQPCRPYDAQRDGLSLGEAAGAILLTQHKEKSEGIVLAGGAASNDANHISGPSRTGEPLAEAMKQAMKEAHVAPTDISFVNAHGTATIYNDEMESKAMALAELSSCPINSLKPFIGHTLGASGVVEIAIAAEELKHGVLIGTKGFEHIGTPVELNVSASNRALSMKHCLKSASGFGGCNAAIVLSKEEYAHSSPTTKKKTPIIRSIKSCTMQNGQMNIDGQIVAQTDANFATFARDIYHQTEANLKFFKMSNLCKMGYLAAEYMMGGAVEQPYSTAIVLSNRSASLDADLLHWRIQKVDNQPASPAAFVYTLANIVMGEIAIRHQIKGETTFFIADTPADDVATNYAHLLLNQGKYQYVLTGWCELLADQYNLHLELLTNK